MPRTPEPWTPIAPPFRLRALCVLAAAFLLAPYVISLALGQMLPGGTFGGRLRWLIHSANIVMTASFLVVLTGLSGPLMRKPDLFSPRVAFNVRATFAVVVLVLGVTLLFRVYLSQVTSA